MQNKVPKLQNINSFGSIITLFLPSNGYRHHPLKVKSYHPPHTEDIMPKLFHAPHHSVEPWATYMKLGCGAGKRGTGWSEGKRETLHMQNKSMGEFSAGSLWYESYHCTRYVRLSPLVQSHINTDSSATLSIPREKRNKQTNTEKQGEKQWHQEADHNTREHPVQILSFTDGANEA